MNAFVADGICWSWQNETYKPEDAPKDLESQRLCPQSVLPYSFLRDKPERSSKRGIVS